MLALEVVERSVFAHRSAELNSAISHVIERSLHKTSLASKGLCSSGNLAASHV